MELRIFGPVPSRRLGKSLGVNNIPHKICSYSCVYCQVGKAVKMQVNRQGFYQPEDLVAEVETKLSNLSNKDEYPDYLTIVPDGEPTLDIHLGKLITGLKALNIPVAVITNASLMDMPDVREDLLMADYVSVKADTFHSRTWRKINIPHRRLDLSEIMQGLSFFTREFTGKLVTETMLVKGLNDSRDELENTARFIGTLVPSVAYIAIPTRPPAFSQVLPADESTVIEAFHIFSAHIRQVELLTGYEGNAFSSAGNFREDMLSITAVHPMREDAVIGLLKKNNEDISVLTSLIEEGMIEKSKFGDYYYYLRKFHK